MPRIARRPRTREPERRPRAGRLRAAARPTRAQAAQPADPCGRRRLSSSRSRRRRILARAIAASDAIPADPPDPAEARSWRGPHRDGEGPGRQGSRQRRDAHDRRCRVAPRAAAEAITGAAWSPDRKWVAFRRRIGGLWVADTVGGAPRQLTAGPGLVPLGLVAHRGPTRRRARPRCDPRRRGDRS